MCSHEIGAGGSDGGEAWPMRGQASQVCGCDPMYHLLLQVLRASMQAMQGSGGAPAAPGGAGGMPDMAGLFQALGGGGGMGGPGLAGILGAGGATGGALPPVANPEETYAPQLQQLRDMGFCNHQENIRALQATGGNVNAAVERLLSSV